MKPNKAKQERKSTSVPGQALGYYAQETKMTELLARSPAGTFVSLEVIDDVATESVDGSVSMVQSKSALTANPVSDRAIPLWKTLSNWATDMAENTDFSKLSLVLAVSNPRDGAIVKAFNDAFTVEEAELALSNAEKELADELRASDTKKTSLAHFVQLFFVAERTLQQNIVRRFKLETSDVSPQEDLPRYFPFIPSALLEDVVRQAQGWVKQQTELLLEKGLPAVLSRDDFHREMTAFIRKHRERAILRSFAPADIPKDKQEELMPRPFVRQLEIIDADFSDRLQAISDYFRATYDRTKWGERAEVHPTSFDEFDDNLERTWQNLRRICELQYKSNSEAERGLMLYSLCCGHTASLEGQEVPSHFVPGSFHHLSDGQRVGWHPQYKAILSSVEMSPGS